MQEKKDTSTIVKQHLLDEKLFNEQLSLLLKNILISVPSSLICALIVFVALYRIPHTSLLEFWFLSFILISVVRVGQALFYLHDRQCTKMRYELFLFLAAFAAILWGCISLFLMPANYPVEQMITVIVIAGVTAGGIQSLQASLIACLLYVSITLIPLCGWAYSHGTAPYIILGFAITFYWIFTIVLSIRSFKFLFQTLVLKHENMDLVQVVQDEKEFLNTMLDNLKDGIIACDSQGKITVFNESLRRMMNIPDTEPVSNELLNYFELYIIQDAEKAIATHLPMRYVLNGNPIQSTKFVMLLQSQKTKTVLINGQPIIKPNNDKLGAVFIIHDISEILKSEKIKNEFVSVVSHELRTPLTSIQGSLSILIAGLAGPFSNEAQKLITIANKNCGRLLLLINDILDIEKLETDKMKFNLKSVSINRIVEEAILNDRMYGAKFDVTLEFNKLKKDVQVQIDPDRLLQVLANLISNAVKFSPPKGVVQIKMDSADNFVHIFVTDKGAGIPVEFQSRIFQKFSQADSSDTRTKGGTGLGLAISKSIMEKLGGSINFVSQPGETTFSIHLPIYETPQTQAAEFHFEEKDKH